MYKEDIICIILVVILLIIIVGLIGFSIWCHNISYGNERIIEIEVQDKYTKGESGRYFIIDSNDNAYQVYDMLFIGKFNSTDIYNKLKIGKKYKVKVTGERIYFFSMYPNINEIMEEL